MKGSEDFDLEVKITVLGNPSVGKTSFVHRYCYSEFPKSCKTSTGAGYMTKMITRNGQRLKISIWYIAGDEKIRFVSRCYYKGAMGLILMYDITKESSFSAIRNYWKTDIKNYCLEDLPIILVGNKCCIKNERQVRYDEGKRVADELGFMFIEASAKENLRVSDTFDKLTDLICKNLHEEACTEKHVRFESNETKEEMDATSLRDQTFSRETAVKV